jgi:predicted RNA-binding protein YlqC (UPF0109 family)
MNDWQEIDTVSLFEALGAWLAKAPCTVTTKETPHTLLIELQVPPGQVGRLIGKKGRTIDALRTLASVGRTPAQRLVLEVIE